MKARSSALVSLALVIAASCTSQPPPPATLDTSTETCAYCRMVVSDRHMAIQIAAPLEEPRFFDDFGCFANYLRTETIPRGGVVYAADHRTAEWVRADRAVYSRVDGFSAPMGSPIMAHASDASRTADPAAAGGVPIDARDVLPAGAFAGGRQP
jgi:copper chaperone NosL